MEARTSMIFLALKSIADSIESHFIKGFVMALGVISLLALIIVIIIRVFKSRKTITKFLLCMLCVLLVPQVFAIATFVEFKDRTIVPEQIGILTNDVQILNDMIIEESAGFTLTDLPPSGTCARGDYAIEQIDNQLRNRLEKEFDFDFHSYTYLFVRGINNVNLSYSIWCNGLSWYLGLKGYYCSFEEARINPASNSSYNPNHIYVFRFPKKYIQTNKSELQSGYIKYLLTSIAW